MEDWKACKCDAGVMQPTPTDTDIDNDTDQVIEKQPGPDLLPRMEFPRGIARGQVVYRENAVLDDQPAAMFPTANICLASSLSTRK